MVIDLKKITFESCKFANLTVKNRIVRSATYEGMAFNGHVTDELVRFYRTLAEGGVGLIITGHKYVHKTGKAGRTLWIRVINSFTVIP